MKVLEDGSVVGTFKYVTGYTGFNESEVAEQSGYYFPFTLNETGSTMTFKKNGEIKKQDIPFEANNVFRVTQTDTFTVLVDDVEVITFNFEESTFTPQTKTRSRKTTK